MKKFVLFLLLVLVLSAGAVALLLRNDFDKVSENRDAFKSILKLRVDEVVFSYAPRPIRLFLFKNMPGLFPVVLVCEQRAEHLEKDSVFSGDIIEGGQQNTLLFCPNDLQISLFPGARARLMPRGSQPGIELLQGNVNLRFREGPLNVRSDLFRFSFTGQAGGNQVNLNTSHDGFSIGCLNGAVKGNLEVAEAAGGKSNFLLSRDCLFSLKSSASSPDKHLLPGDAVALSDLEHNRTEWKPQDQSSLLSDLGVDLNESPNILARIDPVPSSQDTVKLIWQSGAPQDNFNCTLYIQENDRAAPQAAHRFQGSASAGELVLLKGFLKFWMSISCNNGAQSFTSNVLAPLQ